MFLSLLVAAALPLVDTPVTPPAIVGQATTTTSAYDMTLGNCEDVQTPDNLNGQLGGVSPAVALQNYWYNQFKEVLPVKGARVTVLAGPEHGVVVDRKFITELGPYFKYTPEHSYLGQDKIAFLVEVGGKSIKVVTTLIVVDVAGLHDSPCFKGVKRISSTDTPELVTGLASWLSDAQLAGKLTDAGFTVSITDLPSGALGQTTGTSITLDTNAANNNWFIDTTPADNSEFLPTSNPYEWVAKEGSAAYGKMDMLSVLLHEYGHALGIDHSADGHDYMATTLTAGVRRLPSAEELALMQQLVGEVKVEMSSVSTQGSGNTPSQLPLLPLGGFGLAFLGRLRSSRYGSLNVEANLSTLVTQFAVTANAKLTNGNFSVASGMPVDNGWATQGSVDFANGAATLKEVSTSQTRLNQVFVVNPRDRFLGFTLAGSVLDDVTGAPDDAFEVALLDANTGQSLAGAFSLTHTDAMLNLQADGTETAASSVTRVTNPDGSRTYRVDLSGIAVGTAVNLSFDLIGFGKASSQVTVRDVRVSGLPELHDDAATMNEDGSLAFDPFA